MTVASLPRIISVIETRDCPDSECPHCGARGRWIISFRTADGRTLSAMRGCFKLFPQSPLVREEERLRAKASSFGGRLNRLDDEALAAIEACAAGYLDEHSAIRRVESAKRANSARYRSRQ